MQAKGQRQGQGASVTALAAVTHAEAVKLLLFLVALTCTDCNILKIVFDRSSVTALAAVTHA